MNGEFIKPLQHIHVGCIVYINLASNNLPTSISISSSHPSQLNFVNEFFSHLELSYLKCQWSCLIWKFIWPILDCELDTRRSTLGLLYKHSKLVQQTLTKSILLYNKIWIPCVDWSFKRCHLSKKIVDCTWMIHDKNNSILQQ
jgi:hypothetical protein